MCIGIAIVAFNSNGDSNGDSNSDCQLLVESLLFHKVVNHPIVDSFSFVCVFQRLQNLIMMHTVVV